MPAPAANLSTSAIGRFPQKSLYDRLICGSVAIQKGGAEMSSVTTDMTARERDQADGH